MTQVLPIKPIPGALPIPRQDALQAAAEKLEASFLAEMLKYAGFGEQENSLTGSAGESQFASFHREAIAKKIAAESGIGLAEVFYRSLLESKNDG